MRSNSKVWCKRTYFPKETDRVGPAESPGCGRTNGSPESATSKRAYDVSLKFNQWHNPSAGLPKRLTILEEMFVRFDALAENPQFWIPIIGGQAQPWRCYVTTLLSMGGSAYQTNQVARNAAIRSLKVTMQITALLRQNLMAYWTPPYILTGEINCWLT
jgi:hypothetical protein